MSETSSQMLDCPENQEWFAEVMRRAEEHGNRQRVEFWNPQAAAKCLWLLAQGKSIKSTSEITGLARDTVRSLMWRHSDTLETKRKEFSQKYAMAAETYLLFAKADQLSDDPDQLKNISPDRLAITVGVLTDKSMQLSGMATAVVEHRQGASIDDAAKMIAEARSRLASKVKAQAVEAEIVA
jgi:hypothetical protein